MGTVSALLNVPNVFPDRCMNLHSHKQCAFCFQSIPDLVLPIVFWFCQLDEYEISRCWLNLLVSEQEAPDSVERQDRAPFQIFFDYSLFFLCTFPIYAFVHLGYRFFFLLICKSY